VVQAWAFPADSVSPRTLTVTEEDRAAWEDQEVLQLSDALRAGRQRYPRVTLRSDVMLLHPAEALLSTFRGSELLVVNAVLPPHPLSGGSRSARGLMVDRQFRR
jgi:hypothetical protein